MTLKQKLKQIKKFLNIEQHIEAKGIKWTSVECMRDDDWSHGGNVNDVVEEIGMTENYSPMEDYVDIKLDNGYLAYSSNLDYDNFIEFCDKCIANDVKLIVCSHEFSLTPAGRKKLLELREKGIIFLCASGNDGELIEYTDSDRCDIMNSDAVFHCTSYYLDANGKMCWGSHNYGNDIEMIAPTMIPIDVDEDGVLDDNPNGTSFSAPCMLELLRMAIKLNDKINSKTLLQFLDEVGTDVEFKGYKYKYLIYNEEKIKEFMKDEPVVEKPVEKPVEEPKKEETPMYINNPYYNNKSYRISQHYWLKHTGVDLVCDDAESNYVCSICNGTIDYLGWENASNPQQGFGKYVRIKGDDGLYYYYGHLNWIDDLLDIGDKVTTGQLIGREGNTGHSTGRHLHFEVRKKVGAIKDIFDSVDAEKYLAEKVVEKNEKSELELAVEKLVKKEVISNGEYWLEQCKTVKYLDQLFIKFASNI